MIPALEDAGVVVRRSTVGAGGMKHIEDRWGLRKCKLARSVLGKVGRTCWSSRKRFGFGADLMARKVGAGVENVELKSRPEIGFEKYRLENAEEWCEEEDEGLLAT
jgi:hypothetical protein